MTYRSSPAKLLDMESRTDWVRPRLVVSRCLELDACRYNGARIRADMVAALREHAELIDVCPEVAVGLGVPRAPVRLVYGAAGARMVQPATGRDVTDEMRGYGATVLDQLPVIDGFLLKSASPSCGLKGVKLYHESGYASAGRVAGMFGGAVLERFAHLPIEDEARLNNAHLRHHFLLRLFAHARLRAAGVAGTARALVEFHTRYKLVLMVASPALLQKLGNIVATQRSRRFAQTFTDYSEVFSQAMHDAARPGRVVNALQHAFGYVSGELNAGERAHFMDVVDDFRRGGLPIEVPLALMRSWIERFDLKYLAQQAFFEPYPRSMTKAPKERIPSALAS